jgi:hypothetical protein
MYFEKVKTPGGLFVYDSSEVSPLALLLLGAGKPEQKGRLMVNPREGGALQPAICSAAGEELSVRRGVWAGRVHLGVEDWVYFEVAGPRDQALVEGLREMLTYLLAYKLEMASEVRASLDLPISSDPARIDLGACILAGAAPGCDGVPRCGVRGAGGRGADGPERGRAFEQVGIQASCPWWNGME